MVVKPWEDVWAERHKVLDLLASMRAWVGYDERSGQGVKPPGEPLYLLPAARAVRVRNCNPPPGAGDPGGGAIESGGRLPRAPAWPWRRMTPGQAARMGGASSPVRPPNVPAWRHGPEGGENEQLGSVAIKRLHE